MLIIFLFARCERDHPSDLIETISPTSPYDYVKTDLYQGKFELLEPDVSQKIIPLVFRIIPVDNFPKIEIRIIIPKNLKLIEGDIIWKGDGIAKQPVTLEYKLEIQDDNEREWEIRAVIENIQRPALQQIYYGFIILDNGKFFLKDRTIQNQIPLQQLMTSSP